MDSFLSKTQLALSRQIWHKSKTKKQQTISGEKDYSVRHFKSVLTTTREIPKNKEKNPDKMCQLIILKIYPQ